MSTHEQMIRDGTLVGIRGPMQADLAIEDGKIAAVAPDLEGIATEEIDARGLHVFPGAIYAHVHLNELGRTHWEGFATRARALAAEARLLVVFAFWGGLVLGNLDRLDELAERGVGGVKTSMSTTDTLDFEAADPGSRYRFDQIGALRTVYVQ